MQASHDDSKVFGLLIGGVPVLMQAEWNAEYFESQDVVPVPTSTPRILGVTQVRGEAVPVFDPEASAQPLFAGVKKHDILVVEHRGEKLAIASQCAPVALLRGAPRVGHEIPPGKPFAAALSTAQHCQPQMEPSAALPAVFGDGIWWKLDLEQFFAELTGVQANGNSTAAMNNVNL